MNDMDSKFSTWFEQGFDLYKRHFAVLVLASLIGGALSLVSLGILSGAMIAGLILIVNRLLNGGEPKPEAGDVLKGFEYFLPMLLFSLVWGIALFLILTILRLIPCIGPLLSFPVSFGAQVFLAFAPFLIVERKMDFWSASKASVETVRAHFLPLLGIILVASILGGLGSLFCGIGLVVTFPLTLCILSVVYRDVFQPRQQAPRPEMISLEKEHG